MLASADVGLRGMKERISHLGGSFSTLRLVNDEAPDRNS